MSAGTFIIIASPSSAEQAYRCFNLNMPYHQFQFKSSSIEQNAFVVVGFKYDQLVAYCDNHKC